MAEEEKVLKLKPTMVYFHGGDLTSGLEHTNFSKLAAHGSGLVLVDVSYRLNLDGFLSIDAMVEESSSHTSGAFGLYDMLESLRWVQRNIKEFQGDPAKVTIFGQSSGGTAVMMLLGSPLAAGLFSGVMSLSGSPNVSMSAALQRKQHQHIVDRAGCAMATAAETLKCLRAESTKVLGRLWLAEPKSSDHAPGTEENPSWLMDNIFDIPRHLDGLRMPGLAVVDGDVLREPIMEAFAHVYNDVPVIFSTMGQECGQAPGRDVSSFSREKFDKYLVDSFAYVNAYFGLSVVDLYAPITANSTQRAFDTIAADIEMTCGNLALAEAAGRHFQKSPVYLVYNEQFEDNKSWAFHGHDLMLALFGDSPSAVALRDAWHEFAATGRVSGWQPVTAAQPWATIHLQSDGVQVVPGWKQKECEFWRAACFGPEFWWSN